MSFTDYLMILLTLLVFGIYWQVQRNAFEEVYRRAQDDRHIAECWQTRATRAELEIKSLERQVQWAYQIANIKDQKDAEQALQNVMDTEEDEDEDDSDLEGPEFEEPEGPPTFGRH